MRGTRCHMMAMYVVLESYLGMVCDYPEAYEGQPGFELLPQIPTTWDETKVLDADVSSFVTIARRKNNDWYIGSITNHEERNIVIDCNFLPAGNYQAVIYTDAPDANEHPNNLQKLSRTVSSKDKINISLKKGGGAIVQLKKL